jgi:hypothetical protein
MTFSTQKDDDEEVVHTSRLMVSFLSMSQQLIAVGAPSALVSDLYLFTLHE